MSQRPWRLVTPSAGLIETEEVLKYGVVVLLRESLAAAHSLTPALTDELFERDPCDRVTRDQLIANEPGDEVLGQDRPTLTGRLQPVQVGDLGEEILKRLEPDFPCRSPTFRIYTHKSPGRDRALADFMGALIKAP